MENNKDNSLNFVLKGNIGYSVTPQEICTHADAYVVCENGICQGVFQELPEEYREYPVKDYGEQLILPGMVDLHIHAPQYAFKGFGMDLELLDWLNGQAFPEEMKYEDLEYAKNAYEFFVKNMKNSATTRACIFATRHRRATVLLMELLEASGLIAYVGKVNMDRNSPEGLREVDANTSLLETRQWLEEVENRFERTKPILTPRFIPSCTDELLEGLNALRQEYKLSVQSHLSENPSEVQWVKELSPEAEFYGDAYDRHGLFGGRVERDNMGNIAGDVNDKNNGSMKAKGKTVMAHCIYSTAEEIQRMQENGVYVAHCPASNMNLSSGIAPIRKYLDFGVHIGLGSDVAGGHTESIFRAITDAIQVSKLYWRLEDGNCQPLTFQEAFYLATKGGGEFFGKVGSFEKGYEFDAIVIDDSKLWWKRNDSSLEQRLERAVYSGYDTIGLCGKYIRGKKII